MQSQGAGSALLPLKAKERAAAGLTPWQADGRLLLPASSRGLPFVFLYVPLL